MPSRRDQISLTPEEVDAYLREGRKVLNVATIGPTGHPHVVAMWFEMIDDKPTFWTFGKSQKILNLRRDPKISALVETGEEYNELKGVELVGAGRIIEDFDEVLNIGISVARRYQGEAAASDAARPFIEAQARKRLGVVIEVEHVVSWDHSKLGGTY